MDLTKQAGSCAILQNPRKEIKMVDLKQVQIKDSKFTLNVGSLAKLLDISACQNKTFDYAIKNSSQNTVLELTNSLLQTEKSREQIITTFVNGDKIIGFTPKKVEIDPDQFLEKVNDMCKKHNLKIESISNLSGLYIHTTFDSTIDLGDKDIYKTGVIFLYDPKAIQMTLGLWRLACSNGQMVKTRGTTISLNKLEHFKTAEKLLSNIKKDYNILYQPVLNAMAKAKETPASLYDLQQFSRLFKPHLGEEKVDEVFKVDEIKSFFNELPEKPSETWFKTATLPISCFDLYNIGTNLATHDKRASSLDISVAMNSFLFKQKPLASICKEVINSDIFDDVALLRGEN